VTYPVFLDTGIFVAWLVPEDARHRDAATLFDAPRPRWMTSLGVVAEAYAWFLHRIDEDAARTFRLALADLEGLTLLGADASHHRAVERKLERLRGRKLTWVDASCLVFLAERKIRTVWGTDLDLGLEGATVVPGPARR
jgi:predicted nucleic acid-binding protein